MEIGQPWPGSVCDHAMKPAARRTWACGESDSQGVAARPCPIARSISQCHDGWKATSSIRLPKRSYGVSRGWFSLASMPCSRASAVPASAPIVDEVVDDLGGAVPLTASTSARSEVTTLCPTSGGAWLVASRMSLFMWIP